MGKRYLPFYRRETKCEEKFMFKIGCSENILEVPLFAELYGYGPFQGRRNLGVHDPLYCRAVYFDDGKNHAMVISSDLCTMDQLYCAELRAVISSRFHIVPECIAFTATHTHSGPALGTLNGIGFGEPDPRFQETWKKTVVRTAEEAFLNPEEISGAEAGRAPLTRKLGKNRVEPEKNATDESIRWIRFLRPDGSCKILLHSHGIHGIAMNLPFHKLVSADWMGAANRKIKERSLASMPLFFLGPCGDVNTCTSCHELNNDTAADVIADQYLADLENSLNAGGEKITDLAIRGMLKTCEFPVVEQSAESLRKDAETFQEISVQHSNRLVEMAIALERGANLKVMNDLQVIRFGKEISFLFIPGEYFVEDGAALMARAQAKYSFAVTVANGKGGYFPSESDMKRYPDIQSALNCPNNCRFGFYEIYCYAGMLHFKYQDHIAEFTASNLLTMEESI